jgi:hypothetical protein
LANCLEHFGRFSAKFWSHCFHANKRLLALYLL